MRMATEAERRLVQARFAPRRAAITERADGQRRERTIMIVVVLVVTAVLVAVVSAPVPVRIAIGVLGVVMAFAGVAGRQRATTESTAALSRLDAEEERLAKDVRDIELAPRRIVTATDADGDGITWWLVECADGWWAVYADSAPAGLAAFARSRVRLTVAGVGAVLEMKAEGDAVPVDERHLREPDFRETPETRYWSMPVDGSGATFPIRLAQAPVLRAPERAPPTTG